MEECKLVGLRIAICLCSWKLNGVRTVNGYDFSDFRCSRPPGDAQMFAFKKLVVVLWLGLVLTLTASYQSETTFAQEFEVPDDPEVFFVRRVLPLADEIRFYRGCTVDSVNHPTAMYQMNCLALSCCPRSVTRKVDPQIGATDFGRPTTKGLRFARRAHRSWTFIHPRASDAITSERTSTCWPS